MAGGGVRIEWNDKDVINKMRAIYNSETRVRDELVYVGLETERLSKEAVPVDTGRLKTSIHVQTKQSGGHSYQDSAGNTFDGRMNVQLEDTDVAVGTNVNYAEKIHERGGRGGKGQDFLLNAFNASRTNLLNRLAKALRK